MKDADGKLMNDKTSITEIFAKFYEELYRSRRDEKARSKTSHEDVKGERPSNLMDVSAQDPASVKHAIPKFDAEELEAGLKSLKSGKAKDSMGSVSEMLKVGGARLRQVLLQLMNAVLEAEAPTPAEWHQSVMKILFKGGDATQEIFQHHRPPPNTRPVTRKVR